MTKKKVIVNKKCYAVSKDGKCCAIESYQCTNCFSQLKLGMKFCYECGKGLDWK